MTEIIVTFPKILRGLEKPIKGFGLNYFSKLFSFFTGFLWFSIVFFEIVKENS